ncbi:sensor histidine kinase [Lichenibacterium dinghuense]|uniref:sensor histidine kinase n=1 Tax=Lichenibacterium dinghuense TaxID=2895977 RepID=UPI001F2202A7|nr:ATP-binding protein [Lichenibacterium sp. 6Y81]
MLKRWAAPPALRRPRSASGRIILVLGACGLAFILGTAGYIAAHERQIAFREARASAQGAAFSLADHASRLFEVSDLALRTATLSLSDMPWDEAEASRSLHDELRATSDVLPYIRDLVLADADGRLRAATLAFPVPQVSLVDRPAFAAVRGGAEGLILGDPIVGKVSGKPSFLIARRLVGADGRFRGMAAATADLDYFLTYWRRLELANDAHVALVRPGGGQVLVRLPEVPPIAPTSLPALSAAVAARPVAGLYDPAPERLGFYQRVGDLPVYLTVSYSEAAVEAGWRAWLWGFLLFPAAAILALFGLLALARRQSRVEARASLAVDRARAALATANLRLEQRVAERTADLRESNAEVQRFAYIVSHDLRAPLVNIMGFTSELQRLRADIFPESAVAADPTLRADFDEAIGFIQSSIDKMDRLIKAILTLARQGSRVFQPEPVDMGVLMRSIVDGVAHRALSAGATLSVGPMPVLVVDRIAAEQVFSNLVDNAVKYLRPGVPGRVSVTAEVADGRAAVRVADDGRGIDPRDHGRVFELFRRSGAQDRPGDGIGLAHVKTLVRQLGGTIALDSAPGRGSTFTVTLPLEPHGTGP